MRIRQSLIAASLLLWSAQSFATPPLGADLDSPEHAWFEGADTPDCVSCCGEADGKFVMARPDSKSPVGWAVLLDDKWTPIPVGVRTTHCRHIDGAEPVPLGDYRLEPHGRAVVWIVGGMIFCFSPPGAMS